MGGLRKAVACIMSLLLMATTAGTGDGYGGMTAYAETASATDAVESGNGTADGPKAGDGNKAVSEQPESSGVYTGENYEVSFVPDNRWDSGYNATVTIKNTGEEAIENWCVSFPLEQQISNIWNAGIKEAYEDFYVIKNAGWNQDIPAGGSVSFGMTCYEAFTEYPDYYTMIGNEVSQLRN